MHKDFDAAAREAVGEPLTFKLGGEVFTCTARLPALPMLQLAKYAGDDTVADAGAAVAFYEFIQGMLVVTDVKRFEAMMKRERVDMDQLKDVTSWVIAEMTGRPTRRPSDSPERPLTDSLPSMDVLSVPVDPVPSR